MVLYNLQKSDQHVDAFVFNYKNINITSNVTLELIKNSKQA